MVGLDIGERSRGLFTDIVSRAKTIIWNGPLGAWEADNFSEGSKAIVKAISEVTLYNQRSITKLSVFCFLFFKIIESSKSRRTQMNVSAKNGKSFPTVITM